MKFLIIFAVLLVSAYAEFTRSTGEDLKKYRDECVTSLSIPAETVEEFKKWQFTSDKAPCYIHCIFDKMSLFTDGNFVVDNLATQLSHGEGNADDLKPRIESCIDNSITDNCQKAFKGFNCFKENDLYMIKKSVE